MQAYIACTIRKIYCFQINYKPVINDGFDPPTPCHNEIYNDKNSFSGLKIHAKIIYLSLRKTYM